VTTAHLPPRRATVADFDALCETLTLAFREDPVWPSYVRPPGDDPLATRWFWDLLLRGAMRHPGVWTLGKAAAVSVWIPPGGTELSDEQNDEMEALAISKLGRDGAATLAVVSEQFEQAHPRDVPHYYLSLLATHPDWRGRGLGIGLLDANLVEIDKEGIPSYLESSNPANDMRYQGVGYQPVVTFVLPKGQRITGMWRPVAAAR
jgi:GNAT superfamily N-acetyltransferase